MQTVQACNEIQKMMVCKLAIAAINLTGKHMANTKIKQLNGWRHVVTTLNIILINIY
jgi:hypothetical protein